MQVMNDTDWDIVSKFEFVPSWKTRNFVVYFEYFSLN